MALLKHTRLASPSAIPGDEPGGVSIEQVPIKANFGTHL